VVLNFGIALLGLYYLLRAPEGSWGAVREYIPFSIKTADALRDRFVRVAEATVIGLGVVAVAQGALIGLGFAIARLPSPVFWGGVALLASFVPIVGATLVWFPATVVLLSQERYGAAIAMAVIGGVIAGNIDQLLRPVVYRRVPNMHSMITLVGALAGIRAFGAVGLLLGPLLIYLLFELMRFFREEYVRSSTTG
jgi:predicted PurR-regulated permease PerM